MSDFTYTADDCVDHLLDYMGGGPDDAAIRDCRRAVNESYREVTDAHRWSYLTARGEVACPSMILGDDIGVVSRDADTGNLVVPAHQPNLAGWSIIFPGTPIPVLRIVRQVTPTSYEVDQPEVLAAWKLTQFPRSDYRLFLNQATLPVDFVEMSDVYANRFDLDGNLCDLKFVTMDDWERSTDLRGMCRVASVSPDIYTVGGDPLVPGRLVFRYYPVPFCDVKLSFSYRRRPARIQFGGPGSNKGTVSCTAGGVTITGEGGTVFPSMFAAGNVVRLSANASRPSSPIGSQATYNPAVFEARVLSAVNGTLKLDRPAPATLSGVGYTLGSPIDFEQGAMIDCFLRCCEKNIARFRAMKVGLYPVQAYKEALELAKGTASVSYARRAAGDGLRSESCRPRVLVQNSTFQHPPME